MGRGKRALAKWGRSWSFRLSGSEPAPGVCSLRLSQFPEQSAAWRRRRAAPSHQVAHGLETDCFAAPIPVLQELTDVPAGSVWNCFAVHDRQHAVLGLVGQRNQALPWVQVSTFLLGLCDRPDRRGYFLGRNLG